MWCGSKLKVADSKSTAAVPSCYFIVVTRSRFGKETDYAVVYSRHHRLYVFVLLPNDPLTAHKLEGEIFMSSLHYSAGEVTIITSQNNVLHEVSFNAPGHSSAITGNFSAWAN